MKIYILISVLFCCMSNIYGQNTIRYTHDDVGNRIKRETTSARNDDFYRDKLSKPLYELPIYRWNAVADYSSRISTSPVIYQTPPDPYRILDKSLEVGCIEGVADVSSTGAATYQIPIKVVDGTNRMQPQVSVSYNSQATNSIMGYGWSLSATSTITRIGKNHYFDGMADELKLNASDNLMLDGKRLILTSGANLTIGSAYAPEIEDYSIVEYTTINARDAFRVKTKDGLIYEYGANSDSYIRAQNSSAALYWLLSKVTDRYGNYMLYHYDTNVTTGEFYLSSIEYTGNSIAGVTPYSRVEFVYNTRNDVIDSYVAGNVVSLKRLLTGIKCINNEAVIKEYKFKYIFDHYYSKLCEVEEYGLNGARYNSTIVNWGDYHEEYSKYARENYSDINTSYEGVFPDFEDFDGDGKADMMTYPTKPSYTSSDNAVLYLAIFFHGDVSYSKKCSIPLINDFLSLIYADLNGDGKLDVIRLHKVSNNNYRFEYFIFNGQTFQNAGGFNNSDARVMVGDFNGDGKMELLTRDAKVYNEKASVIASGGIDSWGSEYVYCYPNNNYIVDFNGDGKSDVLAMDAYGSWVYTLNGNTFSKLASFNSSGLKNSNFNYFGDFNGDGKTDVICQNAYNVSDVSIYLSTGRSFIKKQILNHDIEAKILVGDLNRDGKDEIVHLDPPAGNSKLRIKIGTFNGTGFDNEYYNSSLMEYSKIKEDLNANRSNIALKDFDGDGRVEFMLAAYANTNLIYAFNDKQNLQVKGIKDGYNKQVDFRYALLTEPECYKETSTKPSFPVVKARIPLSVVSNKQTYATDYSQALSYKYNDLYVHRQGKGLLCFGSIEETDNSKNIKTISSYNYDASFFVSYLSLRTVKTTGGVDMHRLSYQYNNNSLGNKRYEWQPYITVEEDCLRAVSSGQIFSDYIYGNPQLIVKLEGDEPATQYISYMNVTTSNLRLLGLPLNRTIQKGDFINYTHWEEETVFSYDSIFNISNKVSSINEENTVSEENYTYDVFGNIVTKSIKPYDSTSPLVTTYRYSANGQNLIEMTDVYGFQTFYLYNNQGKVIQSTNHKNQSTTYKYDNMGNLVKTVHPDKIVETNEVAWAQSVPQALYSVTKTSTVSPTTVTYYNVFDTKVREGITQFDGEIVYTDSYYDRTHMLQKESLPFTGTKATLWNTYMYDEFSRPTKIQYASGKEELLSYSGTSITETRSGITTTRTKNATGKLMKVIDESGTINYKYQNNGNIESIHLSDDLITTFAYDPYGRQISITDPSAGTITYSYDMYGNKTTETDARGKTVSLIYDKFGKIQKRITPETTFTYTYNPDQLLSSITGTNGTSFNYTYDEYGNLLTEKEAGVDGKWLQKNYSYTDGVLTATTYQTQAETIATESYTYANGHLKAVKIGNMSIWDLQEVDVFGHPTKVVTGNITRHYTYDEYGFPTGRTASSSTAGTFSSAAYKFNPMNGNLNSRKDVIRNLTESFTYDNLNRLVGYKDATVTYNNFGNILSKSDAGTLEYNGYKTQGITPVGNLSGALSKRQDITYTSFMRPDSIVENGYQATFSYNAENQRVKMQIKKDGNDYLTRYYLGNMYELDNKVGEIKEKLYLGGSYYDAYAVYVKQGGVWQLNYICRDYLGSITHITNDAGSLLAEYSYDAWGRLRNPVNQSVYAPGTEPELMLGRGYTGHEHMAVFGLVNMNARLYDPILGRFLSPDPYVQLPDNLQGFNRYTYGMNNPLCYVDENGEFWWFIAAAVIGGAINVATNWKNIDNVWQGLGYFGVGALAGATGFAVGGAALAVTGVAGGALGGAIAGFASGAASGFILGGGNAVMAGGNFNDFMSGATNGAFTGAASGLVMGGVFGGALSYFQGKNVWNGADIATGRNAFSVKNTPVESTSHSRPAGSQPNQLPSSSVPEVIPYNDVRNYSVTTYGNNIPNPMMEGRELILKPLQIKGYNPRLANQIDLFHDFPRSFDDQIINEGWLYGTHGNSTMMVAPGTVNGANGIYTVGINSNTGIIYHRTFYEWKDFYKNFHFPVMPY